MLRSVAEVKPGCAEVDEGVACEADVMRGGDGDVAGFLGPCAVGTCAIGDEFAEALFGVAVGAGDLIAGLDLGEAIWIAGS